MFSYVMAYLNTEVSNKDFVNSHKLQYFLLDPHLNKFIQKFWSHKITHRFVPNAKFNIFSLKCKTGFIDTIY